MDMPEITVDTSGIEFDNDELSDINDLGAAFDAPVIEKNDNDEKKEPTKRSSDIEVTEDLHEVAPDAGELADDQPKSWQPPESDKHLFDQAGNLRTWRKEAAAEFAKLPPVVQTEIIKRENDIMRGIEQYKQVAQFGERVSKAMQPYLPVLQQYGVDPANEIADLLQVQSVLAFGSPEQKARMLIDIARDYGVNIDIANQYLQQPADPERRAMQQQMTAMQRQLEQAREMQSQQVSGQMEQVIAQFRDDPANIYFDDVYQDMAGYVVRERQQGRTPSLKEAYDWACRYNTAVQEKERAKAEAARAAQEAEKVRMAKQAKSVNVSTSTRGGSVTAPAGSVDDTLRETMAAIKRRG